MDRKSNFRRGSVELMVLHLLSLRDYYGYELTQIIRQETNGVIDIPIGSLYPALYKLIDAGYISDHKEQVEKMMFSRYPLSDSIYESFFFPLVPYDQRYILHQLICIMPGIMNQSEYQ